VPNLNQTRTLLGDDADGLSDDQILQITNYLEHLAKINIGIINQHGQ
jgi:hypothetical protein